MVQKKYQKLLDIAKHTQTLNGIQQLLDWDQETCMPEGAAAFRAEQLKVLSGIIHKQKVGKKFANALSQLVDIKTGETVKGLDEAQAAAVKEWRRDYLIEKALPQKFVEEFTFLTSNAMNAWREAREDNNFKKFAPFLQKIIDKVKKKAELIGYKEHPYDALVDLFEPGISTKQVTDVFQGLRKSNSELLKKIVKAKKVDDSFLYGKYPEDKQLELSRALLEDMGFNFKNGRIDLSTHPFSSSFHPTDSRVTTRIAPDFAFSCLSTILHEGGHSLYEMGLPIEKYGSPLGEAVSLGIHESQSRWWETRIGLSRPFWKYFLPKVQKAFPDQLKGIDFNRFYNAINKVEPSLIRVEADEVTYPLHVILRFELEKGLVDGSLKVKDIPEAWNAKMQELLGISPPSDREGCLQDVHWSMGALGYFPTYALGNLFAAQLFTSFAKEFPDWETKVENGNLLFIKEWLHKNIYQHGRRWRSLDLIKEVSKKPFAEADYNAYLTSKYSPIYSLGLDGIDI